MSIESPAPSREWTSALRTAGGRVYRRFNDLPLVDRISRRLSPLALLPAQALVPLERHGLDPVERLGHLRRTEPVSRLAGLPGRSAWLVTGHDEARAVLADSATFSNDFGNLLGLAGPRHRSPGGLGFSDPPEHTRLRRLVAPEFTRARLTALEPAVRGIVDDQLDALARKRDSTDLWTGFALPIPTRTICELLGIAEDEQPELQRLSTSRFDLLGGARTSFGAIAESLAVLRRIVSEQRRAPGPGLIGRLVTEHGDALTDDEIAGLADGLLTGGLESTASMLALGTIVLLTDEVLACDVRAGAIGDTYVDELLRHLTVVQAAFPRFARHDTKLAGVRIGRGDVVICSLSGANRDEHFGADPDSVDPARPTTRHLAFGHGIHRCVGAELARLELRIAYPALLRRFPDMRLAVPFDELRFRRGSVVYGLDELPVRLRPQAISPVLKEPTR